MKTLGILGGVGPQTTAKVYLSIIDSIRKNGGEKYPEIIIYNLPFPFIIEDEVLIQGINSEKMVPYLINGAKILEKAGANFGILPCNTLHKYIKEIRQAVNFPFLSILEETVLFLKSKKIKNIGILASETTINSKIYEDVLIKNNIQITYPLRQDQDIINNIITEILKGIQNSSQQEKLIKISNFLHEQGAEAVLLACTDLQLISSNLKTSIPIIDTTEILINASVREMSKK